MKDTIVSVRLPKSLVGELKQISERQHFMDLSEAIRSILRQKCMQHTTPYSMQIKRVVTDIQKEIISDENTKSRQEMMNKLRTLLEEMEEMKEK